MSREGMPEMHLLKMPRIELNGHDFNFSLTLAVPADLSTPSSFSKGGGERGDTTDNPNISLIFILAP